MYGMRMHLISAVGVLLPLFCVITSAQRTSRLYAFGAAAGDSKLPSFDETSSPEIPLKVPVQFYNNQYDSIYVNSNGMLSFLTEIPNFFNVQFPLEYPILAGLYSDVDISIAGDVWYRETSDPVTIEAVTWDLRDNFAVAADFNPQEVFLATWDHVAGSGLSRGKTNTFQIAIASDGTESYIILSYEEGGIQWLQSAGKTPSQPDALAQAGLISGDGRMYLLKASGTDQVRNLPMSSNVRSPGKWIFRVGQVGPTGNVILPDDYQDGGAFQYDGTCARGGTICHSSAKCVDYASGFCCECLDGQYGNGINCINDDTPIRVTGKVSGKINDIDITDADLHSYTLPSEGRTYTAVSNVPETLGYDIQTASTIAEGIVWLFARPKENTKNGFMLTGGLLNRTAEVDYPQTGDHLTIHQQFHGLDVFNNIQVTTNIHGTTPSIPKEAKIESKTFSEEFTRGDVGELRARSTRAFTLKDQPIETSYNVKTIIEFEECEWGINETLNTIRMKIGDNGFIQYDVPEEIIRYALTATVGPLQEEDPCIKGKEDCGPHSQCVVDGDSYRCLCDRGYEQLYDPNQQSSVCLDKDECETGRHQCSKDALCLNNEGSYTCRCNHGFSGNGFHCASIAVCDQTMCGNYAECQINGDVPVCVCQHGYIGDGYICTPSTEQGTFFDDTRHQQLDYDNSVDEDPPVVDINDIPPIGGVSCAVESGICSPYADCVYDNYISDFQCICRQGYIGNGFRCDPTDQLDSCNIAQNCSPYASCVDVGGKYECKCLEGFYGDGITCNNGLYDYGQNQGSYYPDYGNYGRYDPQNALPESLQPICLTGQCFCETGYTLIHDLCIREPSWVPDLQLEPLDGVVWPTCGSGGCTCPDGYEFMESTLQCHPIGSSNNAVLESHPIPECLFDECICPIGYDYVPSTDSCRPTSQPGWDHSVKGGATRADTCDIINNCHPDAQCIYNPSTGHHECQCNDGFVGDGILCHFVELSCEGYNICDVHAECLYDDKELRSVCVCQKGYTGDGTQCTPQDECSSLADCHVHAQCTYNDKSQRFECQCNDGYEGNGLTCDKGKDDSCNVLNNCPANSECLYNQYLQDYDCQCMAGYVGDGYYCEEQVVGCNILNNCGENAVCDYDYVQQGYRCRCNANFDGDGFFCKSTLPCTQDPSQCHPQANCVRDDLSNSGYSCQCMPGYTGDGTSCQETPAFESNLLLINQGMAVLRMPVSASGGYGFPIHVDTFMTAVGGDVDCLNGRYYWTDMGTSTIRSSMYDGSEKAPTVSGGNIGSPEDVAVDWVSGNLYWTDSKNDAISVSSVDGKLRRTIIEKGLVNPRGIAVHPGNGILFWSDWNRLGPKIEMSGLDGSHRRVLVEGNDILLPNSLVVDYYTQNLCWVDAGTHRIECVGIEGRNRRVIVEDAKYPFGFTLHDDMFFYTDWNDTKIHEVDKFSGEEISTRKPPPGGSGKLYDIVSVPSKCPSVSNVCQRNRGNCPATHLCLPNGRGGRTCACPNKDKSDDKQDCVDFVH